MADNYLENRYEDYLARKQKKEAERKARFYFNATFRKSMNP